MSNDALEISHISVAATLESADARTQSRVRYAGASLPCKYHQATPPMPTTEPEFRKVLSQEI